MIIALGHKKRSGKDVAARYLVEHYGFHRIAFADNLKKAAAAMCGFTESQLHGSDLDKESIDPYWGFSPRYFFKTFGTEVVRGFSSDFWIKSLGLSLKRLLDQGVKNIVVSDLRFQNEADFIKNMGGYCIRINRKSSLQEDIHSSETALDLYPYDFTVENNTSLNDLFSSLDLLYSDLSRSVK